MKWVQVVSPNEAEPSKLQGDPLFMESKSGEEVEGQVVIVGSKATMAGLAKLVEAIQVQMVMLQSQLMTQEWLAGKLEHLAVMLNKHWVTVEELLEALNSASWGFGAGLGAGLDTWAEMVPRGEWSGIRVTQEEVSEEENDK